MKHRLLFPILLFALIILAGCDTFNRRINEPAEPTSTPRPFSTATPGGRISISMISEDEDETPNPEGTAVGEIIGPAATATAVQQQFIAATQTAAAPTPQPAFQPDECPEIRGLNAPAEPATFTEFPAVMGTYLSNGGAPSVLESTLRQWGAITDRGGVVQADTDLTGDKIPEILVNIFNPFTYNVDAVLNSGLLLIYGCDNNAYRLLYATPNNAGIALPVLHRVGDMNADVKADIVMDTQSCTTQYCSREGFILTWNPVVGVFEPINSQQILAINGRLGVVDIDGDGVLELTVSSSPPASSVSGPTRSIVEVWDWTGQNYVLAVRTPDEARYRIHALHDADEELLGGNSRAALRGYFEVRDNASLLPWTTPNENSLLRAFATYRILTTYARIGDERTESMLGTLLAENPEGTPGAIYAVMGQAFMDSLRSGADLSSACQAALGTAAAQGQAVAFLNSYGFANRSYTLNELCPF